MWIDLKEEMKATGHIPCSPEELQREELLQDRRVVSQIVQDLLAQPSGVAEAEAWYELIADEMTLPLTVNSLVKACAKAGRLQRAFHWAEVLQDSGSVLTEEAVWSLLYECGRQSNFAIAEALLTHHTVLARPKNLGAFLVSSVELGRMADARRWLGKMEEISEQIGGAANLDFLSGVAKAASPELAKSWWSYMRRKAVTPRREHYDALISASREVFSEAQRWFQQLIDDGFTPKVSSYTALLAAANADVAEELLQQMLDENLRPSKRTYSTLVQVMAKSSNVARAVQWLELSQDGTAPPSEASYNTVIGALAGAKRWGQVEELLRSGMMRPDIFTDNNILAKCARSADEEGVTFWLERMKEAGLSPDLVAFNTLVDFHARQGRVKTAFQWIERLKESGFSPNILSYSPVVLALARAGDTGGAAKCLRTMIGDEVMPNAVVFSAVLHCYVGQGDVAGADAMLSRLVAEDVELDPRSFDMIIRLCNRQGEHHLAIKWFQHARHMGSMTSACASAACASLAAIGEAAETAALLQKFEEDGLSMKVRAYASLARAWAAQGRIILAVYTIGKMYAAGHQCTSLTWATLLEACRSQPRRFGEAELLLRCMAEHKASIPGDRAMSALLWTFGEKRLERLLRNLWLKVGEAPSASQEEPGEKPCWFDLQRSALRPPQDGHRAMLKRIWSPRTGPEAAATAAYHRRMPKGHPAK